MGTHVEVWLTFSVLAIAAIETVQAFAWHHLRRLGLCSLGGAAVAAAVGVAMATARHARLTAVAAAHHVTAASILVPALLMIAGVVTVVSYAIATWRGRGYRPSRGRPMPAPRPWGPQ